VSSARPGNALARALLSAYPSGHALFLESPEIVNIRARFPRDAA